MRHHLDDPRSRDEAVLAVDGGDEPGMVVIALQSVEEVEIVLEDHPRLRVEDVDRAHALGLMPLADLEIVEVMCRRDLDRARALLGIGIFVGHDRDQPADQRQTSPLADQMLEARVVGVDRDRGVAEHRLGPRGGDGHTLAGLFAVGVDDRILEIVEMAVRILGQRLGERRRIQRRAIHPRPFERAPGLDLHDLEVGDRGLELGVPIDEPLVLVDEPFAIEMDKNLRDRAREAFVKREPLAAPVAGGAEALELADDRAAQFRLPRPDVLEEFLAPDSRAGRAPAAPSSCVRRPSGWRCPA